VHVDCDAFFASVEQALRPGLKGKPVVTGKERGIAVSMSYEAKARGVVRGMRIFEVKQVCPECAVLPSDYETYSLFSKRFFEIIRRFTPDVEECSIDEAYAELSGLRRVHHGSYQKIALRIKQTVEAELGITVSVGLSLTKSLAKIASKHRKPSGFTCVKGYELHRFLKGIPAEKVCGFGPNTVALLKKQGVITVWDYVNRPRIFAKKLLGKVGDELWQELRGEAVYPLLTRPSDKQVTLSKVKTFTPPSADKEFIRAQLLRNLESALVKLRRHRLRVKVVGIFIKDREFRGRGIETGLTRASSATLEVTPIVSELFERLFCPGREYRQTGVIFSKLEGDRETQNDLFEDPCRAKAFREISACADRINSLYGKHTLHLGSTHALKGETFRRHIHIPIWNISL